MASHSPLKKQSVPHLTKWILPIVVLLLVVLITAFLVYSNLQPYEAAPSGETDKLFKLNLQHFANTIAVDNGKYFILDDYANLTCLDAHSGKTLWRTNVGRWYSEGLLIKNGTIYAGTALSVVQAVDEATGTLLKQYEGLRSIGGWKGPPNAFFVENGRIFIEQYGCNAYNITTGEILWTDESVPKYEPSAIPYTCSVWAFEGNRVFGEGLYHIGNRLVDGIYRMNPDTSRIIWEIKGYIEQEPLLYQDKMVLSSYGQDINEPHNSIIAVNVDSGVKVWSYDVRRSIYEPVIVGDRLLFIAQDGSIYALNISNGSLAWKTSLSSSIPFLEAGISALTVDIENQMVYWAYGVTRKNSTTDYATYEGTLYRMNLVNGQNLTKSQFQATATGPFLTQNNPTIGLALLKNTAYLTVQTDLWCFNRTTLIPISTEHFDHTLLKPIAAYGRVYVTADLYVMSYKDTES